MKITTDFADNILRRVADMGLEDEYTYIGVRVQYEPFELGELSHRSRVWIGGEETPEELDGVCVMSVDALVSLARNPHFYGYPGDHAAIVVGNCATYGEDEGELIIEDATVVYVYA